MKVSAAEVFVAVASGFVAPLLVLELLVAVLSVLDVVFISKLAVVFVVLLAPAGD